MTIFVRLSLFEETSKTTVPQGLQGFQHNLLQKNFSAKPQMKIISSPLHLLYPTWIHEFQALEFCIQVGYKFSR